MMVDRCLDDCTSNVDALPGRIAYRHVDASQTIMRSPGRLGRRPPSIIDSQLARLARCAPAIRLVRAVMVLEVRRNTSRPIVPFNRTGACRRMSKAS
jgi:hypothetical protein